MQPLWEQNVSFKQALAIAAVQKRKFDEEIKQYEQKNAGLEQQIENLKLELAKYRAAASPELLLTTIFNSDSPSSSSAEELFSLQLETLAISATIWTRAAEILPSSNHSFLCQVFEYTARRRIEPNNQENAASAVASSSSSSSLAAAGTSTPTQALIHLTHDIITTPFSSTSSSTAIENILTKAASCLGELCKHPHECLTLQDFSLLQEFISTLLTTACCSTSDKNQKHEEDTHVLGSNREENGHRNVGRIPTAATVAPPALSLLEALQSSCGTGYLVLGCASHTLKSYIQRLKGIVTGEIMEVLEKPPPPPLLLLATATPSAETCTTEEKQELLFTEESLLVACGNIAPIVQSCLRQLPSWSAELPSEDEFLREVAAAVWAVSSASEVIAPAHGEIAKQGQRCAALLVSALQQMAVASSARDDCGTTATMDTFE